MKTHFTFFTLGLLILASTLVPAQNQRNPWKPLGSQSAEYKEKANRWASHFASLSLSVDEMKDILSQAPKEKTTELKKSTFLFYLPMPDGSYSTFKLVESPVMEDGLARAYPQIKTYAGKGVDDPTATLRCDITPFGFHAMMISANASVFVDPVDRYITDQYVSYYKHDALQQDFAQHCLVKDEEPIEYPVRSGKQMTEGQLRTYRLALACTGEYAAYYGGTVVGALTGMVITMNRVNGVYERELGIHMNIIANDTLLIFTNALTDGYTNDDGGTMLGENQTKITQLIGSANYDIGHVFSTGGGGIAGLGVICSNNSKAHGVTGLDTPIGDAFDIDYVAHEMGHQFGANHTFNSTAGSCGGGNRVGSAAYEPGSASTIMGYAGICGNQDLQPHSDDYFHTKSFDEIVSYTQNGQGNTCPVITTDSNNAPVLVVPGNYSIPLNTPFRLTASATDPDGDTVTYCWEEFDLGPAGNWNTPAGNAPIFRSFNPVTSGTRLFPKLINILNNNNTIGEIKPSYARALKFRCVVRDNDLFGTGVIYNPQLVQVNVVGTPGPFAVLTPNTTGITWLANSTETVTWSVNGTDQPPINTPTVNVLLSLDGGYTFPITLGSAVPNTGSYSFTVPDTSSTTSRIMVEAVGNIYFDINDKNFYISQAVGMDKIRAASTVSIAPNPANHWVSVSIDNTEKGNVEIGLRDLTGKLVDEYKTQKNSQLLKVDFNLESLAPGMYFIQVKNAAGVVVKKLIRN